MSDHHAHERPEHERTPSSRRNHPDRSPASDHDMPPTNHPHHEAGSQFASIIHRQVAAERAAQRAAAGEPEPPPPLATNMPAQLRHGPGSQTANAFYQQAAARQAAARRSATEHQDPSPTVTSDITMTEEDVDAQLIARSTEDGVSPKGRSGDRAKPHTKNGKTSPNWQDIVSSSDAAAYEALKAYMKTAKDDWQSYALDAFDYVSSEAATWSSTTDWSGWARAIIGGVVCAASIFVAPEVTPYTVAQFVVQLGGIAIQNSSLPTPSGDFDRGALHSWFKEKYLQSLYSHMDSAIDDNFRRLKSAMLKNHLVISLDGRDGMPSMDEVQDIMLKAIFTPNFVSPMAQQSSRPLNKGLIEAVIERDLVLQLSKNKGSAMEQGDAREHGTTSVTNTLIRLNKISYGWQASVHAQAMEDGSYQILDPVQKWRPEMTDLTFWVPSGIDTRLLSELIQTTWGKDYLDSMQVKSPKAIVVNLEATDRGFGPKQLTVVVALKENGSYDSCAVDKDLSMNNGVMASAQPWEIAATVEDLGRKIFEVLTPLPPLSPSLIQVRIAARLGSEGW